MKEYFNHVTVLDEGLTVFDLPLERQYATIAGILPVCSHKNFDRPGFDKNTNLYIFYIDRCLNHLEPGGELIVQTPSSFLKNCPELNKKIYSRGTITDIINTDKVNHIIWRFVDGDFTRKTLVNGMWKKLTYSKGQIMFLNKEYKIPFSDLFTIKVGAISGCNEAFEHPDGNRDFVTCQTPLTGQTKKVFFNVKSPHLQPFKEKLMARKVKKFHEGNWWVWGRNHHISDDPRIYVPCKTKLENPFFHHPCKNYDGTILAIFFKPHVKLKPPKVVNLFNKIDWDELGFRVGGRYLFSQKSLESVLLPEDFASCVEV